MDRLQRRSRGCGRSFLVNFAVFGENMGRIRDR